MRRRRVPTILQMEAVECGAASLAMILAHHGRWESLERLRAQCGVTRDGSKASNLLKAARRLGLSAKGFRKEPEQLPELPLPAIIHWNFCHYVVFEGFEKDHALLNDPAEGPRRVPMEEFEEAYTGVVLAFEPGEDFERAGRAPGVLRPLFRHLDGEGSGLVFLVTASLLLVLPGLALAGLSQVFVDQVLVAGFDDWLLRLMLGLVVAALFQAVLVWLQQRYLLRIQTKLGLKMASSFVWDLLRLPMSFFTQRHAGDLADRISANDSIARLLSGGLAGNVVDLVSVVVYGIAIALYDVTLAAVGLALAGVNVAVLRWTARARADANRALLNDQGKLAAATLGMIRTMETLRAGGREQETFAHWAGFQARVLSGSQRLGAMGARLAAWPMALEALTAIAVLGIGGYNVMAGTMTVGALVAVRTLMGRFTAPIASLVDLWDDVQRIQADLARLDDVRAHPPSAAASSTDAAGADDTEELTGALRLEGVTFGYSPFDPPLIEDFDLDLAPGARVALVGGSGSGKSTLGRLMCGLAEPAAGRILYDGIPLEALPRDVFANAVSYVDQDVFLFEGTVRENLTLWADGVPEDALTRALRDAAIDDVVLARRGGLDAHVEEGGGNFSGGQRQRLEIARALVSDPALVILDEATAALDPITELTIDDNLRRRGCACVIIAHRLSTIRDCDEIVVLDRGRIVERGDHASLMAAEGVYAALIRAEGT
jgi:NHLM bacteriocin system ABC transporter peptidase/ATP-binding protein